MTVDEAEIGRHSSLLGVPLFWWGVILWVAVMVVFWPLTLSFGDEVGYVGQAKLLLEGRFRPMMADVGVWHPSDHGLHPKYPPFLPIMLAPLLAISPVLVFLPGILAAVGLAWLCGRIVEQWGRNRLWGLIVLVDPTIVTLSRTVMADVLLACFGVATWYFMRRGAFWRTVLFAAATMAIKTNGVVIAGSLLVGEALSLFYFHRGGRDNRSVRRLATLFKSLLAPALGMAVGAVVVIALNLVANGTIHSSYRESASEAFGLRFLGVAGLAHAKSLLLCPPLLFMGAWALWRRREIAPLVAAGTTLLMMSVFFYVDWGLGRIDTLVLSRRLILPVVAFLLVGYADLIAGVAQRLSLERWGRLALVGLPAVLALAISLKHRQWQAPSARALLRAESWTSQVGTRELGLTPTSRKVGLLYSGRTVLILEGQEGPAVVLCGTADPSYRLGNIRYPCALRGYETVESLEGEGYEILMRSPRKR